MRVVSLTCSNTEIVHALGCDDFLVGVDDHSDWPPELVAELPRVGPDLGIDVERVASLEPDLVLASLTVPGHEKVVEAVDRAGLPYLAPSPKSIEDVYGDIATIGAALGVEERARDVVSAMRSALESVEPAAERPKLLVQWWPKPVIAPGRLSWVQGLLERAGAENPLGGEDVESRPLEDDEVATIAPDAILLSWCGVEPDKVRPDVVYAKEAWQGLEALREERVYLVPEAWLGRPSPRLVEGYAALRDIVEHLDGGPAPPTRARR
jgi:iron complex transport system substrate-binding protein